MTTPKTEYGVFKDNCLLSPIFNNPAHALTWAVGRGLCKAVGHGWTPLPQGYDVRPIQSLDIDAIYKNPKVMEKCCGACVEHPCPAERNSKVVHGLAILCLLATTLTGCTTLSPNMQVAEAVSKQVNSAITYQSDAEQYGQSDRWVVEPTSGKGDCEDYALTKAERLNAGGIVTSVEVCIKDSGPAHAVAVVHDQSGEWVLDNLRPWAVPLKNYDGCRLWLSAATMKKAVYHGK